MSGGVSERVVLVTVFCLVWQCLGAKAARAGEVLSLSAARRPAPWRGVRGVVSRLSAPSGLRAPASARAAAGQIEFRNFTSQSRSSCRKASTALSGRSDVVTFTDFSPLTHTHHGSLTTHRHAVTSRMPKIAVTVTHTGDTALATRAPPRFHQRDCVGGGGRGGWQFRGQYRYGFTRTHRRQERRMSTALGSCTPWHALGCSSLHHHT